jgi:RNA polymerase sigma-70 factor, ECF subfamily
MALSLAQQSETGKYAADALLVAGMRNGDQAAFETLFTSYYTTVHRVLTGQLGDLARADDVAQETFLALYHSPPQPDPERSLLAWLCRVAFNRALNLLRSERRSQLRAERVGDITPAPDPEQLVLRREEQRAVHVALAALPERQQQLLLLRNAGLSYTEIAQTLDIAPGSIGTLLARAERAFIAVYQGPQDTTL